MIKAILIASLFSVAPILSAVDAMNNPAPVWMPLANSGAFGLCLAWFMLRNERWLQRLTISMDKSARVNLLMIMTIKTLDHQSPVKILGEQLKSELANNENDTASNENFTGRG